MRMFTFGLLLALATLKSLAAQDSCANALTVVIDNTYIADSYPSTDAPPNCINFNNGQGFRWYVYTATQDTSILISTDLELTDGTDTRFHVLTGDCNNLVCVGGNDDNSVSGTQAQDIVNVTAGTTYYIVFDNRWSANPFAFNLTLSVAEVEPERLVNFTAAALNASGQEIGVSDMNGDFLDDVISVNGDGIVILSIQNEDGTFTQRMVTPTQPSIGADWSLAVGDYDRNGFNDIVFGGGSSVSFLRANDDGTEMTEIPFDQYVFSQRTNFIDINNDGHLDCFVCHDVQPNVFFMNDGENNLSFNQGSLGDIPNGGNYGSIWIDYDNDGDQDMFIAKCRGGSTTININELHRNNGDGTFTEVAQQFNLADPIQTWSAAWGDYDNDGDLDVFVGASSFADGRHKLMRNDGDIFTDITAGINAIEGLNATSRETVTHDFNNDGYLDIMGAGNLILINNGDMTFTQSAINGGHGPMGDLNNDGFIDIVNSNTILYNDGNDNNYLKVNVIGTASNLNGIGARLEVYSALGKQIREITSGTGFEFMSSLNAHFGIGTDEAIDSLVIRWPSGIVDVVTEPEINSTVAVTEGSTVVISGLDEYNVLPLSIFPNPTNDLLNLELPNNAGQARTISVYDINGRLVSASKTAATQLNVSALATGTYLLLVEEDGKLWRTKFVKE